MGVRNGRGPRWGPGGVEAMKAIKTGETVEIRRFRSQPGYLAGQIASGIGVHGMKPPEGMTRTVAYWPSGLISPLRLSLVTFIPNSRPVS